MSIDRTLINSQAVYTPTLNADVANIGKFPLLAVDDIQASSGYIENLTIKKLEVLNEENGNSESSETYEDAGFNKINLNFADDYNCKYTRADESILESEVDARVVNVLFTVPEELGAKLVCRYLILDLRNEPVENEISVVWPDNFSITWMYGMPDIQAGYFYVLAFQRFAKDLIVGNVAVKLGGE